MELLLLELLLHRPADLQPAPLLNALDLLVEAGRVAQV